MSFLASGFSHKDNSEDTEGYKQKVTEINYIKKMQIISKSL